MRFALDFCREKEYNYYVKVCKQKMNKKEMMICFANRNIFADVIHPHREADTMTWQKNVLEIIKNLKCVKQQRGAIFVLTALLLPIMLGFLGFAYDVGNLYTHKARLQNTADAAALAGARAYVNELSKSATNGVATNATEEAKNTAKALLKPEAEKYIRGNDHLFDAKRPGKTGKNKEFALGTRTVAVERDTIDETKITKIKTEEYFRVTLREPVGLYFLPVIGIKNDVEVGVYATAKLTDTETKPGSSTTPDINDAEYKPVVIAGGTFYDEINQVDVKQHMFNSYNVSTVYVTPGATVSSVNKDGQYVVLSSDGDIEGQLYVSDGVYKKVRYARVVEVDYNMDAFGTEIRKLFKKKQQDFKDEIAQYTETELRAKLQEEYNKELITYNSLKATYDTEKAAYDQAQAQYEQDYQAWVTTSGYTTRLAESQKIWDAGVGKYVKDSGYRNHWNVDTAFQYIKQQWEADGKPYTKSEALINKIFNNKDNLYTLFERPTLEWQGNILEGLWMGDPPPEVPTVIEPVAPIAPKTVDERYAEIQVRVNDEYYMTYHGDRMNPFKSSVISSDTSLSGPKHSYFYLSKNAAPYNAPQTEISIDGFYVDPAEGITEDTPFYLFVESDIDLTNFYITNCNRPVILCYVGTGSVHYHIDNGINVKGFLYTPHAGDDTFLNPEGIHFSGSIVSRYIKIQGHDNNFQYDPVEVKKWQDADEGLPTTINVGFKSSGGGGSSDGSNQQAEEKITLLDRLRLFLVGNTNANSYYKDSDITWEVL